MCAKVVKILHCNIFLSLLTGFDERVHKCSVRANWINVWLSLENIGTLTRWLPSTSILVVTERIYRYQYKCNYLKNQKSFAAVFFEFLDSTLNFNVLKKKRAS